MSRGRDSREAQPSADGSPWVGALDGEAVGRLLGLVSVPALAKLLISQAAEGAAHRVRLSRHDRRQGALCRLRAELEAHRF